MEEGAQIFLIALTCLVASAALTFILLYFLVFPLINKYFKKDFPAYNYSKEKQAKPAKEKEQKKEKPTKVPKEKNAKKSINKADNSKKNPPVDKKTLKIDTAAEKTEEKPKVKRVRATDFHKDVPTVRIDTLLENASETKLTMAKIDAESRNISGTPKSPPVAKAPSVPTKPKSQKNDQVQTVAFDDIVIASAPDKKTSAVKNSAVAGKSGGKSNERTKIVGKADTAQEVSKSNERKKLAEKNDAAQEVSKSNERKKLAEKNDATQEVSKSNERKKSK